MSKINYDDLFQTAVLLTQYKDEKTISLKAIQFAFKILYIKNSLFKKALSNATKYVTFFTSFDCSTTEFKKASNKINEKKFTGKLIDIKKEKKYLVLELTDRLKDVCDDQICWLKQDFIKEMNDLDAQEQTFRPEGPQGHFTWLNTTNIDQIMSQYEEKYKDFKFFGAIPIDFDEIPQYGIRKLNFDNYKKRYLKFF